MTTKTIDRTALDRAGTQPAHSGSAKPRWTFAGTATAVGAVLMAVIWLVPLALGARHLAQDRADDHPCADRLGSPEAHRRRLPEHDRHRGSDPLVRRRGTVV